MASLPLTFYMHALTHRACCVFLSPGCWFFFLMVLVFSSATNSMSCLSFSGVLVFLSQVLVFSSATMRLFVAEAMSNRTQVRRCPNKTYNTFLF
jgi:hypothetical protein